MLSSFSNPADSSSSSLVGESKGFKVFAIFDRAVACMKYDGWQLVATNTDATFPWLTATAIAHAQGNRSTFHMPHVQVQLIVHVDSFL